MLENSASINELEANEDDYSPEPPFGPQHSAHRNSIIQTLAQMDNRIPVRFVSEQFLY